MGIVDFILNLAGLLLWLNWRSLRFDPLVKRLPATLMGTLRPAAPQRLRRWHLLVILAVLLFLRAVIYRWMAPFWIAKLDFGMVVVPFRSDWFGGILFFSFLSFGLMLWVVYIALLFLSVLKGPEPVHALVKVPLGRVDDWSRGVKVVLPFIATAACWFVVSWPLGWIQHLTISMPLRVEQSVVIGLASYLIWKFPAGALLVLHLLSSYIYFGRHPFWKYVNATAQKLLQPLRRIPLDFRKVDFAPLVGIALIFLVAEGASGGLAWLFARLPL